MVVHSCCVCVVGGCSHWWVIAGSRRIHAHCVDPNRVQTYARTLKASFFQTWKVSGSKMVGCRISQLGKTPHVSWRYTGRYMLVNHVSRDTYMYIPPPPRNHESRQVSMHAQPAHAHTHTHIPRWPSWSRWSRCSPPRPPRRSAGSSVGCRPPSACGWMGACVRVRDLVVSHACAPSPAGQRLPQSTTTASTTPPTPTPTHRLRFCGEVKHSM